MNNLLIDLSEISSQVDGSITFNQIDVVNTSIDVLKISNVLQSKDITQNLTFNDITIQDWNYDFDADLIVTDNIKTNNRFKVIFNRILMKNLKFESQSSIMTLRHQTEDALEVNDSVFDNITFGLIVLRKPYSDSDVKPFANFSNVTVANNDLSTW